MENTTTLDNKLVLKRYPFSIKIIFLLYIIFLLISSILTYIFSSDTSGLTLVFSFLPVAIPVFSLISIIFGFIGVRLLNRYSHEISSSQRNLSLFLFSLMLTVVFPMILVFFFSEKLTLLN
ncbi:MAG: hypothetical protein KBC41_02340 [Candidatus Pacebacteria bacterium]|nr:hypothetical protein [Candidatus Paceibacterota bacterium]MBP9866894.1 hypothetical protein [Candidatus Paceibacterota bacterium]